MTLHDAIYKIISPRMWARRTLINAEMFVVGRIGPSAQISPAERALIQILRNPDGASVLFDLFPRASLSGQLYVLLGLKHLGHEEVEDLFKKYRERTDEVTTQLGCFKSSEPACSIITKIQGGKYLGLLEAHLKF